MKKLLSLTICLAMLLGVFTVCAISSHAADSTEDAAVETASSTDVDVNIDATGADEEETVPAKDTAELQETGVDIVPVNLGNSFYARIKMIHYSSYYMTATTNANRTPITHKATGYYNQVWHFTRKDNFYRIRSLQLNKYLELKNPDAKDGDPLIFAAERNAAEQKWLISKDATGYRIHSFVDNGFVLLAVSPTASASKVELTSDLTNQDAYFSFDKLALTSDKLPTPDVKLSNHYQGVLLDWNDVPGAAGYRAYRYNDTKKCWDQIAEVKESKFIDTKISSGNTYKYAVRVVSPVMSDFLAKSIKYIAAPKVSVSNTNDGQVVSWNAVNGAAKYKVFIKNNGRWATLTTTTATSYTYKKFNYNQSYTFTVRCVSADGKTYTSAYNTTGVSILTVPTPNPRVAVMPFSLDVSWAKVSGAAKYRVLIKCKATNNAWKKIADVTGNSYRYSDVVNGQPYYFTVRAMNASGVILSGYKSSPQTYFYDAPVIKTISTATKYNKLSWYAVPGAVKYRILVWNGQQWIKKADIDASATTYNASVVGTKEQNLCYAVRCLDKNGNAISSYLETVIESGIKYYYPGQYSKTHKF